MYLSSNGNGGIFQAIYDKRIRMELYNNFRINYIAIIRKKCKAKFLKIISLDNIL